MLRHLAPVIIPEKIGQSDTPNAAYKVVEELVSAINDPHIKNVAVSADYGAGKSSVVETAKEKIIKDEDIHWWRFKRKQKQTKFLTISLAQLNTSGRFSEKGSIFFTYRQAETAKDKDKDIEYSLLQQLLYYDLPSKTPKSRFYRLGRIGVWRPLIWALSVLLALLCYLILFEPERLRVQSFYEHFAVSPELKFWVDLLATCILAVQFIVLCIWLVRHARFRIGKVKVKDTEVEVNNLSVFNQYLDEIIYFFASTRYNVVIFEDLDRFSDTTRIFGKLRELNKILNSSRYLRRIIKRKITFVYSVCDDLFDATHRVKFFDYIVPVIPVVNSSNAYEKLSEYLDVEDKRVFDGKDLLNLCEFFEDLRLIINIVNEYDLYKKVIRLDDFNLSRKKLFGLIVYKNYCPDDFVNMQNRRGVMANILDNKKLITEAVVAARKKKKEIELEKLSTLQQESNNWEIALRKEYVEASKDQTDFRNSFFDGFVLSDDTRVSFNRVIEEPEFFEELVSDKIRFYGGGNHIYDIHHFDNWQKAVHAKSYHERLKNNPYTRDITAQQEIINNISLLKFTPSESFSSIICEEIDVLNSFIEKKTSGNNLIVPEERHPLLRFLLTHDFLDEHYLDYITYFYPNSISIEDKRFILNATSLDKESLPFSYHLQNPSSVSNRFDENDYKTNSRLLNVDLALSLAHAGNQQKVNRNALQRLAMRNKAIDFVLAVYEQCENSFQAEVDLFLSELLAFWDFGALILSLEDNDDVRLPKLREINLRYSNLKDPEMLNGGFQRWLNGHFGFLASVFNVVGENRLRQFVETYKLRFSKMNLGSISSSFAGFIIDNGYYSINASNLESIASFLGILDDYKKASYTTLYYCNNRSLSSAARQRPHDFIKYFPSTSIQEAPWAKALIAADGKIPSSVKKEYLRKQSSRIQDASTLKDIALSFVFNNSLVEPSWDNVYYLCFEKENAIPVSFLKNNTLNGFLLLKPDRQNAIISQWVFSNRLPYEVYEKVICTMPGFKKLNPGADIRRIDILVSNNLLFFNTENYLEMRNYYPALAAKFICLNLASYLADITNYPVSSSEMTEVLKTIGSAAKQADYLSNHPTFVGRVSSDLADLICELIHNRYLQTDRVEEEVLVQSIRYSLNDEIRLFVARKALFTLPYKVEFTSKVLSAMNGEYARICSPGTFSWLSWSMNNIRIAKYLFDNSFIKGYERYDNKIKIIKNSTEDNIEEE